MKKIAARLSLHRVPTANGTTLAYAAVWYQSLERSSNHTISVPELQTQLLLSTAALMTEHFTNSNLCAAILKFLIRNYSELTPVADGFNFYKHTKDGEITPAF